MGKDDLTLPVNGIRILIKLKSFILSDNDLSVAILGLGKYDASVYIDEFISAVMRLETRLCSCLEDLGEYRAEVFGLRSILHDLPVEYFDEPKRKEIAALIEKWDKEEARDAEEKC